MPRVSVRARADAIDLFNTHRASAPQRALDAYQLAARAKVGPKLLQHRYDVLRAVLERMHHDCTTVRPPTYD